MLQSRTNREAVTYVREESGSFYQGSGRKITTAELVEKVNREPKATPWTDGALVFPFGAGPKT